MSDDVELVAQARSVDRIALERLLIAYSEKLRVHLLRGFPSRIQGRILVEDVVQEALTRAFLKIGALRGNSIQSFVAWLLAIGDNLFLETPASGTPTTGNPGSTGIGTIQQGFLETSNVNVVEEITNLITAQRAYEMNSKVIETSDQMMSTLNNIR